ncbi:MAG: hypothetical protein ABR515_08120 [Nitrososphaeraceae archaeon]
MFVYSLIFTTFMIVTIFIGPVTYSEPLTLVNSTLILSNATFDSINPEFSVSHNSIYATWISNLNPQNSDVMFKKIDKNTKLFTNILDISNTSGISNIIKLRNSEDNVYITWEDKQPDKWKLLFTKSENNGNKFDNVTNLSNTTGNVHLHDLSSVGKNVFVLWAANVNVSSTNKDIFFRNSHDGGDSFSDTLNLSNDRDDSLDPQMVINQNGSIIYMAWTECDTKHDDPICTISFTRSLDGGNTFTTSKIVSNEILPLEDYEDYSSYNGTVVNASTNVIFPDVLENVTAHEEINAINPTVFTTLDGKRVYVLWEQSIFGKGDSDIFLAVSNDYGNSFNSTINISNTTGTSRLAHGQLLGEDMYVTWSDTLNTSKTFDVMLRKIDSKNLAGNVINLSNNSGNSVSPNLLVSNNKIYVTWSDDTNNGSVLLWIGDTSGSPVIKKTLDNGHAQLYSNPLIFDTENKVWIAWTQYDNTNHKIVLLDHEKP